MLEGCCLLQMNGSVCGRIQAEVLQSCDESLGSCKSREVERTVTALEREERGDAIAVVGGGGSCMPTSGQCVPTIPGQISEEASKQKVRVGL